MNTKKELLKDTKQLAKAKGGKCLTKEYINSSKMMAFVCSEGHKFKSCRDYIKAGNWCPQCSGRGRTIRDIQELAKQKQGKCLSTEYMGMGTKHLWECNEGHQWEAIPQNIKSHGRWCPECGRIKSDLKRRKYSLSDMHELATQREGICLSESYEIVTKKLQWKCKYGHTWGATPHSIKQGTWCPTCAINDRAEKRKTHSIETLKEYAITKGGKCLSDDFVQVKRLLPWECDQGHQWEANTDNIMNGGKWCPHCAGVVMKTLPEMQDLAISRGGECLSKTYAGVNSKMLWKCHEGHQWEAIPTSIMRGSWCSVCSSGLGERMCREYFEQLLGEDFIKIRPDWLRTKDGYLMELDGYSEKLGIAFEHHGGQHYKEIKHFHREGKSLAEQQKRDRDKRNICKKHGIKLIEVPSIPDLLAIKDVIPFLKEAFVKANIPHPVNIDDIAIDLKPVYCPDRLLEIKSIAKEKGGILLSTHYLGVFEKLAFKCTNGHYFEANPTSIKNKGSWCPTCAGKGRTIEDMHEFALERGGKCLSEQYINSSTPLVWECSFGHQWKARANNVFSGTWCPTCSTVTRGLSRRKYSIESMQELAAEKGGKCISKAYSGYKVPLEWSCSEGHTWERTPGKAMINKRWCKTCRK